MSIGKGIPISTGFDLNSQSPLDNRTIFKTIAERDSLPSINLYEGLECFVQDTKVKYQYLNGQWKEKEIWDNVTVTKEDSTNKLKLSFYSNDVLKKEVEIDVPSVNIDDIDIWDDATVTKDIVNNRNEISFYSKGVLKKTIYIDGLGGESVVHQIEKGDTAPTDENILLWIDTTSDDGVDTSLSDALILEFKSTIADLNSQVADLKARVLYLEQNGGGGGTVIVDSQYIMLEDGSQLMLEDGDYLLLESYEEDNELIIELRTIISNMKNPIDTLTDEINLLNERVSDLMS